MNRPQITRDTARTFRAADLARFPALLGFDGFVDDIIDVVAERPNPAFYGQYQRIPTLADFANRVAATAGHGTNMELVVKRQKLGGGAPIMGHALALLGVPVTCLGALGDGAGGSIHAVFREFGARATLLPMADAARTHALEFADGKLMLGELGSLSRITFARLLEVVGREKLREMCENTALLGLFNWTMLPAATGIWRGLAEEIFPRLGHMPRVFVDLSDPQKRAAPDLAEALGVLTKLNELGAKVTLGLNEPEARQVAAATRVTRGSDPQSTAPAAHAIALETELNHTPTAIATHLKHNLKLDTVVVHATASAAAATSGGSAEFPGPYVKHPAILTGGGDHFNAGFAIGELIGLPLEQSLCLATATSGYYVRHAASPTAAALAAFVEDLPESE